MKTLSLLLTLFLSCFAQDNNDRERNFYMPLAAAAYSDNPNQCLLNIQKRWSSPSYPNKTFSVYRQYSTFCDSLNDTCSGYIAVDNPNNGEPAWAIYIAFGGPKNFENFYEQFWNYDELVPFNGGGKVNKQIFDAFNEIWINAGMKDDIIVLKKKYPEITFAFVGHSVGGAMASLAEATIVSTNISSGNSVMLYTFGQPRIGDQDFANVFNDLFPYRIVHNADIVPHLPRSFNSSLYQHFIQEQWYPNDMGMNDTYTSCDWINGEDSKCSNSLHSMKLNFEDHKNYFGRNFVQYGINGCPYLGSVNVFAKDSTKLKD